MTPWPTVSLEALTASTRPICYGVLKPGPHVADGVPLLRIVDLAGDVVAAGGHHHISQELDEEFARSRLSGGEVLLSIQGTVGRVAIAPSWLAGANISRTLAVIDPDERVDPRFLRLFLMCRAASTGFDTTGSTRASLNISTIRAMQVPVPDRKKQALIVDLLEDHLSRLDAALTAIHLSNRRLASLRERLVVDAITGKTIESPRMPADLAPAGTLDGELADLPSGWRWTRLGDVAELVGGVTKDAKKQSDPTLPEIPYLRVANVQRARLDLTNVTSIRVPPAKAEALQLQPGDVLMNEGGDRDKLARGWVWEGQVEHCIHQNHVFRARVTDPDLDPYFLAWTANTLGGRWAERNGRQSVNLASISLTTVRLMPVIVPAPGEAARLVGALHEQLAALDRLHIEVDSALARGRALRRALLVAAFAGRLTGAASDMDRVEELVDA